jgi:hypothetical protein
MAYLIGASNILLSPQAMTNAAPCAPLPAVTPPPGKERRGCELDKGLLGLGGEIVAGDIAKGQRRANRAAARPVGLTGRRCDAVTCAIETRDDGAVDVQHARTGVSDRSAFGIERHAAEQNAVVRTLGGKWRHRGVRVGLEPRRATTPGDLDRRRAATEIFGNAGLRKAVEALSLRIATSSPQ